MEREFRERPAGTLPPYTYVPGGPHPHPISDPRGHSHGREALTLATAAARRACLERGRDLFRAGYYWESHEAWEALWHQAGRAGPIARVVQALIKLAAAGVKVRQGQPHGVVVHAGRASALLREASGSLGPTWEGIDLVALADAAERVADEPPALPCAPGDPPVCVFDDVLVAALGGG
jgi:hypothetical protein